MEEEGVTMEESSVTLEDNGVIIGDGGAPVEDHSLTEESEVISNPADSGLILVHLDFHDGSKCKVWLQPQIVKRLQEGDDGLMEELRLQHASTVGETGQQQQQMKRKLITAATSSSSSSGDPQDAMADLQVKKQKADEMGTAIVATAVAGGNLTSQLVEVNLNEAGAYLEQFTEGVDNYIELPQGSGQYQAYQIQQGLILESIDQGGNGSGIEKLKPAYPPRKKRKKGLRRYMKYSVEEREEAVRMIKAGLISQQEASRKYNIPQGTLSDHVRTAGVAPWKCSICNKTLSSQSALEAHHLTHLEARQYLCDFCGFNTKDRTVLLKHRLLKHIEATEEYEDQPAVHIQQQDRPKATAWTPEATKVFLAEYEHVLNLYDDPSMKKKHIWHTLADKMVAKGHIVNARQCCVKWKTMYTSFKSFKDHGEDRRAFSYFDDMEGFLQRTVGLNVEFVDRPGVPGSDREKAQWTDEAILMLIRQYGERRQQFESSEYKRKVLWKDIHKVFVREGYTFAEGQVQNKWKVLVRQFKNYQALNMQAEEVKRFFPWYEEMSNVLPAAPEVSEENTQPVLDDNFVVEKTEIIKSEVGLSSDQIEIDNEDILGDGQTEELTVYEVQPDGTYVQITRPSIIEEGSNIIIKTESINQVAGADDSTAMEISAEDDAAAEIIQLELPATETEQTEQHQRADNATEATEGEQQQKLDSGEQSADKVDDLASSTHLAEIVELKAVVSSSTQLDLKPSKRVEWTDDAVRLLLSQYTAMLDKFRNMFVKKKLLWVKMEENFSTQGYGMTAAQLENKWRVLTRMYVKGKNEGVTKNSENFPFFEEMEVIMENDTDTIESKLEDQDKELYGIEEGSKVWPHSATQVLLNEYEKRFNEFENNGVKKRVLWQEIADALAENDVQVTPAQVENKWKVLLRCYKIAIGAIEAPPNSRKSQQFPFLDKMNHIFSLKEDGDDSLFNSSKIENRENQASWDHTGTMLLLQEYGARLERFDNDYIKRKEYLWHEIYLVFREHGYNYTVAQLMNKWKSLLKKYRTTVEAVYGDDDIPAQPTDKSIQRLQKFPYLVEMGQLLGHNHDLSALGVEVARESVISEDGQVQAQVITVIGPQTGSSGQGNKKKSKSAVKEPESFKDVIKYFEQYEADREILETERTEELRQLQDEKLAPVVDIEGMSSIIRDFEERRLQIEKQRLEKMAKMHKEKMTVLKQILKAVKKKIGTNKEEQAESNEF